MAEKEWRLQIDEVRDRPQRCLELRVREAHSERGFRGYDGVPRLGRIEAREDVVGCVTKRGGNRRIELLARALARQPAGATRAARSRC
jgi:hypothetical protein